MMVAIGVQFHGTWSDLTDDDRARILDAMKDAGVTWVRIDVGWSMLESNKGVFDPWAIKLVDRVFRMATDRGLKILGTFWRSPQWATGSTNRNVFPTNLADYAKAIERAARMWRTVDAWEVWNEPNAVEFADPPDAVKYAELLKVAYPAVKRGNPKALVVGGGPMFVDTDWLAKMYAAGAQPFFDVMSVHPYQGNAAKPPTDPAKGKRERLLHTDALLTLMESHGDEGKPIWFTEFGWSTHENVTGTPVWFLGVSEKLQAKYLKDTLALVDKRYPTVTHVLWYTSRDLETGRIHQDNRGLLRKDFTPKPAVASIKGYAAGPVPPVRELRVADGSRAYDGEPAP
jgi:polysaccharide biosynthesis protein PslG